MPFDFGWPGTFALVVEAWLESPDTGPSPSLRFSSSQFLAIGQDWTKPSNNHADMRMSIRAVCSINYYGAACDRICRPRHDRYGHYGCDEQGNKVCSRGWAGDYCDKPVCRPGCKGSCSKPFECDCHFGFEGLNCDQCIRFPGCKHGTCDKPWQCNCKEGWGGMLCNRDLNFCSNNSPCRNGGTCRNSWDGRYSCQCPLGFGGKNCEGRIRGCAASPCMNGGLCHQTNTSVTEYSCKCSEGFFGAHCEYRYETCDTKTCENGSTCRNTVSGPQCICSKGFEGASCEHKINPCDGNPCVNGGKCTNGNSTSEGAPFHCACSEGFHGHRCEITDHCHRNPCANGATCQNQGGTFKCFCRKGFAGKDCTNKADHCILNPCANGGTCFSLQNDFECACQSGFSGKDCSLNIDECSSNPCRNAGKCHDLIDGFRCSCSKGFRGLTCEIPVSFNIGVYRESLGTIPVVDVISSTQVVTMTALGFLLMISVLFGIIAFYRRQVPSNRLVIPGNEKKCAQTLMNNSVFSGNDTLSRNSFKTANCGVSNSPHEASFESQLSKSFVRPRSYIASSDDMDCASKQSKCRTNESHEYATVSEFRRNPRNQCNRLSNRRGSVLHRLGNGLPALGREENHYENLKRTNQDTCGFPSNARNINNSCEITNNKLNTQV